MSSDYPDGGASVTIIPLGYRGRCIETGCKNLGGPLFLFTRMLRRFEDAKPCSTSIMIDGNAVRSSTTITPPTVPNEERHHSVGNAL